MKKFFFSAAMALAAMGAANATEYVVYSGLDALEDGQVQIPLGGLESWNESLAAISSETYNGRSVYQFGYNSGQWNWCGYGWTVSDLTSFDCTALHNDNAVLKFDVKTNNTSAQWYTKCVCKQGDTEYANEVLIQPTTEWSEVSINLASDASTFYNYLTQSPTTVYAFTVVGKSNTAGDLLYVTNVRYEVPDVDEPVLKLSNVSVSDVTYNSAVVNFTVNQKNLDDAEIKYYLDNTEITASPYTITGLTEQTDYSYTLRVEATLNGETYSDEASISFTTKSENFVAKTWYHTYSGTADYNGLTYFINADCAVTTTEDGALNIKANIYGGENLINAGGYKFQVLQYRNGAVANEQFVPLNKVDGDGYNYEGTTTFNGVEEGEAMTNMQVYFEYPGNAFRVNYTGYKYGDTNENTATLKPIVTEYGVSEVTSTTATIAYTIANESAFSDIKVYVNGAEASSKELTDLTPGQTYNVVVTATGSVDGVEYSSNEATITFVTTEENETAAYWYQVDEGTLAGAYYGSETEARGLNYSSTITVVYLSGKITATLKLEGEGASARGLNPQFRIASGSFIQRTDVTDNVYTYELSGTYTKGDATTFGMLLAYEGGAKEYSLNNYNVGDENEPPTAGISAIATDVKDAAVEYFNLQGVRVQGDLTPGLYIRRQGNVTTKVVVK